MDQPSRPAGSHDLPIAANDEVSPPAALKPLALHPTQNQRSRFEIYRADRVSLTSTLFGGGDWHWRLTAPSDLIIADCGGYRDQAECRAAVIALRAEAQSATLSDLLDAGL